MLLDNRRNRVSNNSVFLCIVKMQTHLIYFCKFLNAFKKCVCKDNAFQQHGRLDFVVPVARGLSIYPRTLENTRFFELAGLVNNATVTSKNYVLRSFCEVHYG